MARPSDVGADPAQEIDPGGSSRRWLVWIVVGLLLLVILAFAYQATRTVLALNRAKSLAGVMKTQLLAGDTPGARRTLREFETSTAVARSHSDNMLWDIGSAVPVLGRNVDAVQTIARVLNDAARTSLPPAMTLSDAVREARFRPDDGRFDLNGIASLEPTLTEAATSIRSENAELRTVEAEHLLGPLRRVTVKAQAQFATLDRAAGASATAARLLPPMLGQGGTRNYLLIVQNNAELRATGGLPGSLSVLQARDGVVTMGFQGSLSDFTLFKSPVLPLDQDEQLIYGAKLGTDIRDVNLTPDFPRAASLMTAMYEQGRRQQIDGVLSVDPVALSYVLRATGPITLGEDTFTSDNVVPTLLHGVYQRFDHQEDQNAYFARAARGTFNALMQGESEQQPLVKALSRSAREGRVAVWSSRPQEQAQITPTSVAGRLPRDTGATPHVGMYLNDSNAGKMDYFLDFRGGLRSADCAADGTQTLQASMRLASTAPDEVGTLSRWVTGFNNIDRGDLALNLRIYAPTGGKVTALKVDGEDVAITIDSHLGRQVAVVPLQLDPGQKVDVTATVKTRAGQRDDAVLDVTPGLRSAPNRTRAASACQ